MVGARGFEPPTSASRTQRSSQTEPRPELFLGWMIRPAASASRIGMRTRRSGVATASVARSPKGTHGLRALRRSTGHVRSRVPRHFPTASVRSNARSPRDGIRAERRGETPATIHAPTFGEPGRASFVRIPNGRAMARATPRFVRHARERVKLSAGLLPRAEGRAEPAPPSRSSPPTSAFSASALAVLTCRGRRRRPRSAPRDRA